MRRLLPGIMILLLLIAACGEAPTPTPSPEPSPAPTSTEGAITSDGQLPSILPTGLIELEDAPLPGTLVRAAATEESGAPPTPETFTINVLSYYQQGGVTGTTVSVVLYGDGRLIRDGVESRVSAEVVDQIEEMLREMDFMSIQGTFVQAGRRPDLFAYSLSVDTDFGSKTVDTQDGLTPDVLLALYDALRALGQPTE